MRENDFGHTFIHRTGSARIDRIYSRRPLRDRIRDIQLIPTAITDHAALWVEMTEPTPNTAHTRKETRPKLWKLNESVLEEDNYVKQMNSFIDKATGHPLYSKDIVEWWEAIFKKGVKEETQKYCRRRASYIRETRCFYQTCLAELAPNINEGEERWREYTEIREEAKKYEKLNLQGAKVWARKTNLCDTDEPSIFHLAKEKARGRGSKIDEIRIGDKPYNNPAEIDTALTEHFNHQFACLTQSGQNQLDDLFLHSKKNTARFGQGLTAPITASELTDVLAKAAPHKSPADDGKTFEFYKCFWH